MKGRKTMNAFTTNDIMIIAAIVVYLGVMIAIGVVSSRKSTIFPNFLFGMEFVALHIQSFKYGPCQDIFRYLTKFQDGLLSCC